MPVLKSVITDIETLSKTRAIFNGELSFQGQGLKLNTAQDGQWLLFLHDFLKFYLVYLYFSADFG